MLSFASSNPSNIWIVREFESQPRSSGIDAKHEAIVHDSVSSVHIPNAKNCRPVTPNIVDERIWFPSAKFSGVILQRNTEIPNTY